MLESAVPMVDPSPSNAILGAELRPSLIQRGQRIVYRYDSKGDLVSVIDRMNQKTSFTYTGNRPHYLEKVVDPLGRTGARTEYNEKGQLQKLFDASGNVVLFSYDPPI